MREAHRCTYREKFSCSFPSAASLAFQDFPLFWRQNRNQIPNCAIALSYLFYDNTTSAGECRKCGMLYDSRVGRQRQKNQRYSYVRRPICLSAPSVKRQAKCEAGAFLHTGIRGEMRRTTMLLSAVRNTFNFTSSFHFSQARCRFRGSLTLAAASTLFPPYRTSQRPSETRSQLLV